MPRIASESRTEFPVFFLYGEPRREVEPRFLHLESLDHRAKPSDWNIRAHAHLNLNHVFFITSGSGQMAADGQSMHFDAPCFLLVPARTVHGFSFTPAAMGWVLTIADAYLNELVARDSGFSAVFDAPRCLPASMAAGVEDRLENLAQELVWNAPGYAAAIEGHLLSILVAVLRLSHHATQTARQAGCRAPALVARFRDLIEIEYRTALPLQRYAALLKVTQAQLRRACLQTINQTPMLLIQERLYLEAQRMLLYTNMTVIEAAHYLGFADAAYFTRFFTKHASCSPREFRRQAAATSR